MAKENWYKVKIGFQYDSIEEIDSNTYIEKNVLYCAEDDLNNLEITGENQPNETINLEMQPDSTHKKIYSKIDQILKKIIKPSMTQKEKVKVMHDYVVNAALFYYMCKRAQIPVRTISDSSIAGRQNL